MGMYRHGVILAGRGRLLLLLLLFCYGNVRVTFADRVRYCLIFVPFFSPVDPVSDLVLSAE